MDKRTLILGRDWLPTNFFPLSTISWEHSIKLFFLDKIEVIEWHDEVVRSSKLVMRVPAVAVAKNHKRATPLKYSRQNLYLRDMFQCQYCENVFDSEDLTIDHVVPKSQGGRLSWENTVTCCRECNTKKANNYWRPIREPEKPDYWALVHNRKQTKIPIDHPSWHLYLGIKPESNVA